MRGANLERAIISGANLIGADLSGAHLSFANLMGADLHDAKLRDADLRRADVRDANLSDAKLSGANLTDANLSGTNLRRANLSGTNLRRANLSGANLSGANLSDANLSGTNLRGTNLRGTNLREVENSGGVPAIAAMRGPSGSADRRYTSSLAVFEDARNPVKCTVFAPPEVQVGHSLMVQVWTHTLGQAVGAEEKAKRYDDEAVERGATNLISDITKGSTLGFNLSMPGLRIDQRRLSLVWQGEPASVQFRVVVPKNHVEKSTHGTVTISREEIPVGEITFKLKVTTGEIKTSATRVGEARSFESYFVSYASADRVKVLERVQMLARLGKKYFMDVLRLEPGDRFEPTLFLKIDESDAVLLFWSSNAKKSEWVMRECRYTISHKGIGSIHPVIIEGPPPVEPPPELQELHLNDPLLYVIFAESEVAKSREGKQGGKFQED